MSLQLFPYSPAVRSLRHTLRVLLAVGMATLIFQSSLVLTASARVESKTKTTATEDVDSFIIEFANGESTCREATPAEIPKTLKRPDDIGIPAKDLLRLKNASNEMTTGGENSATGLTINFDALSQLQTDSNAATVMAAFQRAITVWTDRIKSPITVRINLDYGNNLPNGDPFGDNTLGSTSSRRTLVDYPGARHNLLAGSSGAAETTIYNRLPNSLGVPTDTGNGQVVSVGRSVAFALGIPVINPADQNVATMSFNKKFPYDFNPDDGIDIDKTDFVAVAVHEIGHALGFVSGSGSGPTGIVTTLDLFRFRPGVTTSTFPTAERVMSIGGTQSYFTGETFLVEGVPTTELGLSTGGPEPKIGDGDRRQSSHWKDDALNGGRFIGIMDPTISPGDREEANNNDFAAMETIGWNFISTVSPPSPPPPPAVPANDNFASAQVITGCSGSVGGTNVGASGQAGEQNHSPDGGGGRRSVWYSWQAPGSGSVTFTTAGSRYDTVMGVYTGSAVNSITVVTQLNGSPGKADDNSGEDKTSTVSFNATAGTTYRIAVDGYDNNSGGDFGPITLNWNASNCTTSLPIKLLLDASGPAADQVIAVDSILGIRDPFPVINGSNFISPASDRNTRVVIYVEDLQLQSGAPASALTINLVDGSNQTFNVAAQDYNQNTNNPLTQITFRLPNTLAVGTCKVKVVTQNQTSNTATFRVVANQ